MKQRINPAELPWEEFSNGNFSALRKSLGSNAGAKQLGTSLFKLPPAKTAFPYHSHFANEEAIFILEGEGTLRLGPETFSVGVYDYIALPAGSENAHQLINTSDKPLCYLCISTMVSPDVTEYPDSGKVGVLTGAPPGAKKTDKDTRAFFRKTSNVDYFEGES